MQDTICQLIAPRAMPRSQIHHVDRRSLVHFRLARRSIHAGISRIESRCCWPACNAESRLLSMSIVCGRLRSWYPGGVAERSTPVIGLLARPWVAGIKDVFEV